MGFRSPSPAAFGSEAAARASARKNEELWLRVAMDGDSQGADRGDDPVERPIEHSNQITSSALVKESFWLHLKRKNISLNPRQKKVLNKLLGDFEGKLTRKKWMKLTKASSRTALRDINELIELGILEQEEAGGRSTSYRLMKNPN